MKENIFIQTNYQNENPILAKYGCFALTLAFISQQERDPRILLETKKDVLRVFEDFQKKGYLDDEYFVNDASAILKELTSKKSKQLTLNPKFAFLGRETYFPVLFPVEKGSYEVICYRHKDNMNLTHFSLGRTNTGSLQEIDIIFNTLGEEWLEKNEGLWFASDKRVFKVG